MKNLFFKPILLLILLKAFSLEAYAQITPTTATINWQPTVSSPGSNWHPSSSDYSDWADVTQATPKAYGDGVHDDTAAIQAVLNTAGTVYFPPGTYNISSTLTYSAQSGVIVGSGSATILLWKGASGGTMLQTNGATHCRFVGLTWNGNNIAAIGIDHRAVTRYETSNRHEQEMFENFTGTSPGCITSSTPIGYCSAGIRIGYQQQVATAETFFLNDVFQNNNVGISFLSGNDYDEKILKTVFINNGAGIYFSGAIITVGETNFYQNTSDLSFYYGGQLRLRSVTSQGSGQFISALSSSTLNIQNCQITDWGSVSQWTFENAFPSQSEPTYGANIFNWLVSQGYVVSNSATTYYGYVPATLNLSSSTVINNIETQSCGEDTQSCSASITILGLLQQAQTFAAKGAIDYFNTFGSSSSSTATVFDNSFSNANSTVLSPIQINGSNLITTYNNVWSGNAEFILPSTNNYLTKIVNIPGTNSLSILPADFVDSTYTTPTQVFNVNNYINSSSCPAKKVTGTNYADDTCAVQSVINAAITAGSGAVAYFPTTGYNITSTINITNANGVTIMGGGGEYTQFLWMGAKTAGTPEFYVLNPVNVKMEHLDLGGTNPAWDPPCGILQTSSSSNVLCTSSQNASSNSASSITYDYIYANGGLWLSGLSNQSTVHMIYVLYNMTASSSSQANIFVDGLAGPVTISGANANPVGYLNIDYLNTGTSAGNYDAVVQDNQNLTVGYVYDESGGGEVELAGTSGEAQSPGHVTISGDRTLGAPPQLVINGYTGTLSLLNTDYYNNDGALNITQNNSGSINLLFLNNYFTTLPTFPSNATFSLLLLQNEFAVANRFSIVSDTSLIPAITQAQSALNDLRALANNNLSQTGYNQG